MLAREVAVALAFPWGNVQGALHRLGRELIAFLHRWFLPDLHVRWLASSCQYHCVYAHGYTIGNNCDKSCVHLQLNRTLLETLGYISLS